MTKLKDRMGTELVTETMEADPTHTGEIFTGEVDSQDEHVESDRATSAERAKVIMLSQVVTIIALIVAWSLLRMRRSNV